MTIIIYRTMFRFTTWPSHCLVSFRMIYIFAISLFVQGRVMSVMLVLMLFVTRLTLWLRTSLRIVNVTTTNWTRRIMIYLSVS